MRTSYWGTRDPQEAPDYGLPLFEHLDWFHTPDHGLEGPQGRIEWVNDLEDRDWLVREAEENGIAVTGTWTEAQFERLSEAIAHLEDDLEQQAVERGIIGYHELGEGVIEAHLDRFLEEAGYDHAVTDILATVSAGDHPDMAADELASYVRQRHNAWEKQPQHSPGLVAPSVGDVSMLPGSGTALDPKFTVTEVSQQGDIATFTDSSGRGGYVISDWHNQFIPENLRTENGVYEWAHPRTALEKQTGNAAIVEAVFSKELVAHNRFLSSAGGPASPGPNQDAADLRARACCLIRDQDPAGWQQAYGETPILYDPTRVNWEAPAIPEQGTVIRAPEGYRPCTGDQLREAIENSVQGQVLDYLHHQLDQPREEHLDYTLQRGQHSATSTSAPEVS